MALPSGVQMIGQLGFSFNVMKIPHVNYMIQEINIPGLTLGPANQPTPLAFPIPKPGDLTFNDLMIKFKIDENFQSYLEIWTWMIELGYPESFGQYRDILNRNTKIAPKTGDTISDGTLTIYSNKYQPRFRVIFRDMWPTYLSDVPFSTTEPDVIYLNADVTFKYMMYTIERLF